MKGGFEISSFIMEKAMEIVPIRALQHWIYCDRRCMLIHLEQEWQENVLTAEGRTFHEKVDLHAIEQQGNIRIMRALDLSSKHYGIFGRADVVELHEGIHPYPVEYKRGRKLNNNVADEVQLCAQAICLEEMFICEIPTGSLFYGQPRKRTEITFTSELRQLTLQTVTDIRKAIEKGILPKPVYEEDKCNNCSLKDICEPELVSKNVNVSEWIQKQMEDVE